MKQITHFFGRWECDFKQKIYKFRKVKSQLCSSMLSPLRGWGSLTIAFTGKYVCIYKYIIYI